MANIANQTKRMQTSSFRDSRAGTGMKGDAKAVGVAAGGCAREALAGGGAVEQRRHSGGDAASGRRRGVRAATAVWIWKGRGGGVTDAWGPRAR